MCRCSAIWARKRSTADSFGAGVWAELGNRRLRRLIVAASGSPATQKRSRRLLLPVLGRDAAGREASSGVLEGSPCW